MAKCRIGHIVEAQVLQAIEIDYIDESEVLSPADDVYHIDKTQFDVPFVCGARDLGEALRRVAEGATMIRTKASRARATSSRLCATCARSKSRSATLLLYAMMSSLRQPSNYGFRSSWCARSMPRASFPSELAAGGVATPADAALMMQLGAEGVFVGSGIFKSGDPAKRAAAIVKAVANFTDAKLIAELSEDLARPWWASTPTRSRLSWRSADASPAERIAHERLCRPNGRRAGGPRRFCRARGKVI